MVTPPRRRYCFKTGRRIELTCPRLGDVANGVTIVYEACDRTAGDDAAVFYRFEMWMIAIGVLSLWVVQRRRMKNQSMYEKRAKSHANSDSCCGDCL